MTPAPHCLSITGLREAGFISGEHMLFQAGELRSEGRRFRVHIKTDLSTEAAPWLGGQQAAWVPSSV